MFESGELRQLIEKDGLRGITSNPSLFEKSITESHIYDKDIRALALQKNNAKAIYETISQRDIQNAADEFRHLYEETNGKEGHVSLGSESSSGTRHQWYNSGSPSVMDDTESAQCFD